MYLGSYALVDICKDAVVAVDCLQGLEVGFDSPVPH